MRQNETIPLFDPSAIRVTQCALLQTGAEPRLKAQAAPWTSFALLLAAKDRLPALDAGAMLRIVVDISVEAGRVELATIDSQDRIFDNTILDAGMGRLQAELLAFDPAELDGIVLRTFDDKPLSLSLHGIICQVVPSLPAADDGQTLAAVYDLRRNPISFDFAMFLMAAEIERVRLGLRRIQLVFAPADHNLPYYLPPGYGQVIDDDSRRWRFCNILLPMQDFLPSIADHMVCADRVQAYQLAKAHGHVFPGPVENVEVPIHLNYQQVNTMLRPDFDGHKLQASRQGLRYADQWLKERAKGRKLVTITLRQYGFLAQRNSDARAWIDFALSLDPSDYFVVLIPDTDAALEPTAPPPEGLTLFPEAAFNLGLRMALYERAWLNLATAGGPMMILLLSNCRFLIMRILVEGSFLSTPQHVHALGFKVGEQPAYLAPTQYLVWESDSSDVIQREFLRMKTIIDQTSSGS